MYLRQRIARVTLPTPVSDSDTLVVTSNQMIEIVLPGVVEPEQLQVTELPIPHAGSRPRAGADGGDRGVVRRAADAPRAVSRPAAVPVRARL
jgi:hypothetical protein